MKQFCLELKMIVIDICKFVYFEFVEDGCEVFVGGMGGK